MTRLAANIAKGGRLEITIPDVNPAIAGTRALRPDLREGAIPLDGYLTSFGDTGVIELYYGVPVGFRIASYHSADDYVITSSDAIVDRDDDVFYLTSQTVLAAGEWLDSDFSINGTIIPVRLLGSNPSVPKFVSPRNIPIGTGNPKPELNRISSISVCPFYNSSKFSNPRIQWQFATDDAFTDIVIDIEVAYMPDDFQFYHLFGDLNIGDYYVRARYIGDM